MIHCTDIEFTYDGERLALAGIDLHVAPGEFAVSYTHLTLPTILLV